jgi:outer membrane biogenesis lipoprotein LolB
MSIRTFITIVVGYFVGLMLTGCATWEGVKQDSSQAWQKTKHTIYEATR